VTATGAQMTDKGGAVSQPQAAAVMHVLYSLAVGGAEKLALDMAGALPPERYRAVAVCVGDDGPLAGMFRERGIPLYHRHHVPGEERRLISWLKGIIASEKVEVIHAHQYNPLYFALLAVLGNRGVRLVYTEHGRIHPERFHWKRYLTNPLFALRIDHLVSISESTKRAMARYDNFPSRRIQVIRNGIDCTLLNPHIDLQQLRRSLGIGPVTRVVGTASRLEPIKNIPMMLRAFLKVLERCPDAVLLIAGEGSAGEKLQEFAAQLGITQKVCFLGLRSDLPALFSLIEVFLLVSFTEGISITLLEAMGSGVPAVVTRVGGNPEVVLEGVTGRTVEVGDDAGLAERVLEILENPEEAARLGEAGRERVRSCFSFQSMMDNYLRLYQHDKGQA
jgi:L-malate glycosyltransferase